MTVYETVPVSALACGVGPNHPGFINMLDDFVKAENGLVDGKPVRRAFVRVGRLLGVSLIWGK